MLTTRKKRKAFVAFIIEIRILGSHAQYNTIEIRKLQPIVQVLNLILTLNHLPSLIKEVLNSD